MKKFGYVTGILIVLLVAGALTAGCGKEEETAVRPAASAEPVPEGETEIAQITCPVMGLPIDKGISIDYNGRRIYFCCQTCVAGFEEDPGKYLKKLDEQLQKAPEVGESEERPAHGEHEHD